MELFISFLPLLSLFLSFFGVWGYLLYFDIKRARHDTKPGGQLFRPSLKSDAPDEKEVFETLEKRDNHS